mgnify:CR=1 FL=1
MAKNKRQKVKHYNRSFYSRETRVKRGIGSVVLVAAGLIVLLLCIPAWAWAALLGVALAIAGLVLICVGRRGQKCGCGWCA